MTNHTAEGYIVQDKQGTAIYGYGLTVDTAWAMAAESAGPFIDAYGNNMPIDEAFEVYFRVYGATRELLDKVNQHGGNIAWTVERGVAIPA
jgi:hypothetical protein